MNFVEVASSEVASAGSTSYFSQEEIQVILARAFTYEDEIVLKGLEMRENVRKAHRHSSDIPFVIAGYTNGKPYFTTVWGALVRQKVHSSDPAEKKEFLSNLREWKELVDEKADNALRTIAATKEEDVTSAFMSLQEETLFKNVGMISFEEYCEWIKSLQRVVEKEIPECFASYQGIVRRYLSRLISPYTVPLVNPIRTIEDAYSAIKQKKDKIKSLENKGQGNSAKCGKFRLQVKELYKLLDIIKNYNREHSSIVVLDNEEEELPDTSIAEMKDSSFKEIMLLHLEQGVTQLAKRYRRYMAMFK